jgi:hypothetical protein
MTRPTPHDCTLFHVGQEISDHASMNYVPPRSSV